MPATPEYERNRLARIKRRMAEGATALADIKRISAELVYGARAHDKQRRKGEDGGSGSEYEPNDDEEADDADEVSGEEEEQETTIHMSKAKGKQASTKPQERKRARSKTTVPTTTRTTRASASKLNQTEQTPPNDNNTSPHHTSKDSNSPQADTEMQHSQDITDTSRQIENTVTVHGQAALVCSGGPTNPKTSMRVKRRPTMGHGLDEYARRNGGMKMKINFSAGRVRPLDPVEAANLASQCGIHVRSNIMHVATHWNDYSKEGLDHHIPKAIDHVAKNFEMDPKEEVSKGVCTKILQKGVRQRRYILKRDYFTGRTVQEALSNKPPRVSQQNWEALVNKWSDERNKEICAKNKKSREAVKHHQTTGSRSYPAHFHQLKKEKYNNEDPSPIEFFKETHTNRKTGCMSTAALDAYTAMETKRNEAQPEDEQPVPDTQIVAEVLKEYSSSSTFLSTMGYQSRSGRSRTSASVERVRELEERVEQQNREAIEAKEMYQQDAVERVKAQEAALEEMQRKQKEELEALKKSQEEKNKAYEKKQEEQDNLISFLLRQHAANN